MATGDAKQRQHPLTTHVGTPLADASQGGDRRLVVLIDGVQALTSSCPPPRSMSSSLGCAPRAPDRMSRAGTADLRLVSPTRDAAQDQADRLQACLRAWFAEAADLSAGQQALLGLMVAGEVLLGGWLTNTEIMATLDAADGDVRAVARLLGERLSKVADGAG